jgi:hypothetical protein
MLKCPLRRKPARAKVGAQLVSWRAGTRLEAKKTCPHVGCGTRLFGASVISRAVARNRLRVPPTGGRLPNDDGPQVGPDGRGPWRFRQSTIDAASNRLVEPSGHRSKLNPSQPVALRASPFRANGEIEPPNDSPKSQALKFRLSRPLNTLDARTKHRQNTIRHPILTSKASSPWGKLGRVYLRV